MTAHPLNLCASAAELADITGMSELAAYRHLQQRDILRQRMEADRSELIAKARAIALAPVSHGNCAKLDAMAAKLDATLLVCRLQRGRVA